MKLSHSKSLPLVLVLSLCTIHIEAKTLSKNEIRAIILSASKTKHTKSSGYKKKGSKKKKVSVKKVPIEKRESKKVVKEKKVVLHPIESFPRDEYTGNFTLLKGEDLPYKRVVKKSASIEGYLLQLSTEEKEVKKSDYSYLLE